MYDQHLHTYKHAFELDHRWIPRESARYRFHYFPDSPAAADIQTIMLTKEAAYQQILSILDVPAPRTKIEYYLYPDRKTKLLLMGDDWYAQSIYDEFRIHVLYTQEIQPVGPHEDTHLLSLPWGLSIGFFQEGLAEYVVGHSWDTRPHTEYVRKGYAENLYPTLSHFMRHEAWLETADSSAIYVYSLAGAFVAFLIHAYGKDRFEKFYRETNRKYSQAENETIFKVVYGKDIVNMECEFKIHQAAMPGTYGISPQI